ncbi:MAG: ComEC/Rec2 family competence protein, partial [Actinomycetales bacterium]|nr:ComEC/Rec2 family competence protein [Actinomycetales bacterium]
MSASSRITWQLVPISAVLLWSGLALRAAGWPLWWLGLGLQLGAVLWARQAGWFGRLLTLLPWALALMRPTSSQPVGGGGWLAQVGAATRALVAHAATGVSQPAKALTLGITDGDVSGVSPDLSNLFKSLSLTHLTAVSGANCAILIGVLVVLSKQLGLGRSARTLACIGVLGAYLMLVGDQPSVLRAAIMAAVTLFATGRGSATSTVHLLALAVIAVLT